MAGEPTPEWQAAHDALQSLDDVLNDAYDDATTNGQSELLDQLSDAVEDALTRMNQEDMASRSAQIQAAENDLKPSMDQLNTLKKQLDAMTNDFKTAGEIASGIEKAVTALESYF